MVMTADRRPRILPSSIDLGPGVELRLLDWESNFFGTRLGALVIPGAAAQEQTAAQRADGLVRALRCALREAEAEGYRHLTCRVAADDMGAIWAAEASGLRLMDIAVDLKFSFGSASVPAPGRDTIRAADTSDIPALRAMTVGAFGMTRFAVDPFFTQEQVDAFYQTWATNLFSGLADTVFVVDIDGQVAGFVSCKRGADGIGRIPLVATATSYQRRGIARDLLVRSLSWFAESGCPAAFVKTQSSNYPALSLYERTGFRASQSELSFTTTLNQE